MALAQGDYYRFSKIPLTTTFNTTDYHGGIQNWDITQDQRGFIYVANNFGLLEFDGKDWRNYEVENNTRVRSVYVDADHRIYVGGQNQFGYFEPQKDGSLKFFSLYDRLPDEDKNLEDIWRIIKYENQILFCSYLGLISYDGEKVKKIDTKADFDLIYRVSNTLYLFGMNHGLSIFNGTSFNLLSGSEVLGDSEVTSIIPYKSNSLLIFQRNGNVYKYQNDSFERWKTTIDEFLNSSSINTAILLHTNEIVIGTQNNGLIVMSPSGEVTRHLSKDKGLSNRTVLSLFEDQFHNLWVGQNNGLSMVELSSPFSVIDEQSGLPGTGYCALISDNKLYLGTSNGLFSLKAYPNPISEKAKYQMIDNSGGQVYKIQNINGDLLLAHHNGAFEIKHDKAEKIYDKTGTWKFETIPGTNKILAGTYEGFITIAETKNGDKKVERIGDFIESSRVFEFLNDSVLFMSHGYKGIFELQLNVNRDDIKQTRFYGQNAGFPSDMLINVFKIGNEFIFPAEYGVFRYSEVDHSFKHDINLEEQLGADVHISELEYNFNGNLYFLSNDELGLIRHNIYGNYEKHTSEFVRIRKFLSDDLENITALDHENVLFGAKEGFIHYNPNTPFNPNQDFQIYIRKIESVTDQHKINYNGAGPIHNKDSIPLYPANFSSLKFTFASPYFNGQDEITFQYQLENFDKGWSEWSTINEKEYTNLSQGEYNFKVRAKNVFGNISEPATYTFTVFPPWYRSKFAFTLYFLLLLMVFAVTMYVQSIRYKLDKAQLTLTQKKELERKDSEIEQVSRESEQQISKLRNDKLRSEIDHKNRELATTTMHLINKNEFMLKVRDTVKELSKVNSKESIRKLVKDIDRNLAEDEGWAQFTKHFDQVHGDFLSNIKKAHPTLTPQEIKLCAYLRMNMSSKEIANLLNISVRGVEISRYRLRKKLDINRETNLVDFMLEYS